MEIKCGIYKIQNKLDNKIYIGQSVNIYERWKVHKAIGNNINHKNKDYPLYKAFYENGIENFEFNIIEECNQNELDEKEKYYIKFFNCLIPNGYNQTIGGQNSPHPMKLTFEQVNEIKIALKNTKETGLSLANKYNVSNDTITGINVGRYWYDENIKYPIRPMTFKYCKKCGVKLNWSNLTNMCNDCYHEFLRKNWPDRETLKNLIRIIPFTQIGNLFSVTDNAVRKWCDYYNLPRRKQDINQISDEEWEKL